MGAKVREVTEARGGSESESAETNSTSPAGRGGFSHTAGYPGMSGVKPPENPLPYP